MKFQSVCLVGGRGRMGEMFRQRWEAAGYRVLVTDKEESSSFLLGTTVGKADAVILCVPCPVVAKVCRQIAGLMRPGQVLMDVTSVKSLPMQWMEEAWSGPVIGTHPLFGPAPAPEDNGVAIVPGHKAGKKDVAAAEALFRDIGCEPFFCDAEEHDAATARVQSLNFAYNAAYFASLEKSPSLERFSTPSFRRAIAASQKMLTHDCAMFCEFTAYNPFFKDALAELQRLLTVAADGRLEVVGRAAERWYKVNGLD